MGIDQQKVLATDKFKNRVSDLSNFLNWSTRNCKQGLPLSSYQIPFNLPIIKGLFKDVCLTYV